MQIRLYNLTKNIYEIVLGELSIWYSFKLPVACRRKKTFIVREMDPRHLEEITVNHKFKKVESTVFIKRLNTMVDTEIKQLANKKKEIEGGQHEVKRDSGQGEPGAVVDLADWNEKKRQSGH